MCSGRSPSNDAMSTRECNRITGVYIYAVKLLSSGWCFCARVFRILWVPNAIQRAHTNNALSIASCKRVHTLGIRLMLAQRPHYERYMVLINSNSSGGSSTAAPATTSTDGAHDTLQRTQRRRDAGAIVAHRCFFFARAFTFVYVYVVSECVGFLCVNGRKTYWHIYRKFSTHELSFRKTPTKNKYHKHGARAHGSYYTWSVLTAIPTYGW